MGASSKLYGLSLEDAFKELATSPSGLTSREVGERLKRYGPNKIPESKQHPLIRFLKHFWGTIPWMIEAAAAISALIRHWLDFYVIVGMLMVNGVVGFLQEYKAGNAVEALRRRLALKARVLRDGSWRVVPAEDLVPGDVIHLRLGDIVPADAKVIKGKNVLVDESALTGESLPAEKGPSDALYSGSIIKRGELDAVVIATGVNTYFAKTIRLVEEVEAVGRLRRVILKVGGFLIVACLLLSSVLGLVLLYWGEPPLLVLRYVLVLLIASIPVALPAVTTVIMAIGALDLAKRNAIVTRLTSLEELSGIDVLCSDKTGTITENKLTVKEVRPLNGHSVGEVLLLAALASREEDQDPIDLAILRKLREEGLGAELGKYKVLDFTPFDPQIKRTEALVEDEGGRRFKATKGAPQVIGALTDGDSLTEVREVVEEFAAKGYRAIGVARREGKWEYVGLIALYDPPRRDSAKVIKLARSLGVRVKMVTGDHKAIAEQIAKEVGISDEPKIVVADEFLKVGDERAKELVEVADGFAEVWPEHKYRIVELLQKEGHEVGMTGDGVNDVPALKKANAGIAVYNATDAAKSAASIVLTSPGLSVIVDAIREARTIFCRMRSYVVYRMAETIRVLLFVFTTILFLHFYPITPIMLVILALLNDIPIMMIAYDNARPLPKPARWRMKDILDLATLLGIYGLLTSFFLIWFSKYVLQLPVTTLQTLVFLKLAVAGHLTIYVTRTGKEFHFWDKPWPALRLFLTCELTQLIATIMAAEGVLVTPIGWPLAGLVWGYAFAAFLGMDFIKVRLSRSGLF